MTLKKTLLSIFFLLAFSLTVNTAFANEPDNTGDPVDPPAGTLTASPKSCVISVNSSTCNVALTWSVSGGTSGIQINGQRVSKSGTEDFPVGFPSTKFILTYRGDDLDSETVTATCDPSAPWNGVYCALPPAPVDYIFEIPVNPSMPTGTITVPDCTIPLGQGACSTPISWTTQSVGRARIYLPGKDPISNGSNGNNESQYIPGTVIGSSTGPNASGSGVPYLLPYGSTTFNLFDIKAITGGPDDETYKLSTTTANATCGANKWDATTMKCVTSSGMSGTLFATDISSGASTAGCGIPLGQSKCSVNLNWTTTNPIGVSQVIRDGSAGYVSQSNSGSAIPVVIPYLPSNVSVFRLKNNGVEIAPSLPITANCVAGTTWSNVQGVCVAIPPTANIQSDPSCVIASGAGTCNVNVSWSSTNVVNPTIKQDGVQFSVLPSTPAGSPMVRPIKYGLHEFTLSEGSTILSTSDSIASCSSSPVATYWNGSICSPDKLSGIITPATKTCSITAPWGKTCKIKFTWHTYNPMSGVKSYITRDNVSPTAHYRNGNDQNTPTDFAVSLGGDIYSLYHNGILLDSSNVSAVCASPLTLNSSTSQCEPPAVTAKIWANKADGTPATSVDYREPVTLTWSSTNATVCTGSGLDFVTGGSTSSSKGVIVKPKITTTYGLECKDNFGRTATDSVKVNVGKIKVIFNEN